MNSLHHVAIARLIVFCIAITISAVASAQTIEQHGNSFVITGTLEASAGQPRIHVQLSRRGKILTGKSLLAELDLGLEDIMGKQGDESSFMAYLDTGASAYVISQITAQRFGILKTQGSVFHEVGVSGEVAMNVSKSYTLSLFDSNGMLNDQAKGDPKIVSNNTLIQLKRADPNGAQNAMAMQMMLGEINIIGMPAIKHFVVEIDTRPMTVGLKDLQIDENAALDIDALLDGLGGAGAGPAVKLHPPGTFIGAADVTVPLKLVDYNRRNNPADRGALPDLASNPVLDSVTTKSGNQTFTGDWLLDTGAAASIISTKQAMTLGLVDVDGEALQPVRFQLTLGGVSGKSFVADGFVLDRLTVPCTNGQSIVYKNAHVIVHDVSIKQDNGNFLTLDGIFGLNLLMPTMGGLASGLPTDIANGPFSHIIIDTANRKMHLTFTRP